jgi:hypothetical protein
LQISDQRDKDQVARNLDSLAQEVPESGERRVANGPIPASHCLVGPVQQNHINAFEGSAIERTAIGIWGMALPARTQ